jgi:pimeloyl-ACP methyl ester carboxylesterase
LTCGGVGLSDRTVESVSLETRVLDIEAVADSVGADQFALFCTMASGSAAITYAHRHPDRVPHLILWNSYARAKDFFFGVERNVALGAVMQSDWEMFTEISQGVAFGWGRDEGREYGHFFRSSVTAEMYAKYGAGDVRSDVTD